VFGHFGALEFMRSLRLHCAPSRPASRFVQTAEELERTTALSRILSITNVEAERRSKMHSLSEDVCGWVRSRSGPCRISDRDSPMLCHSCGRSIVLQSCEVNRYLTDSE